MFLHTISIFDVMLTCWCNPSFWFRLYQ